MVNIIHREFIKILLIGANETKSDYYLLQGPNGFLRALKFETAAVLRILGGLMAGVRFEELDNRTFVFSETNLQNYYFLGFNLASFFSTYEKTVVSSQIVEKQNDLRKNVRKVPDKKIMSPFNANLLDLIGV